MNKPQTIEFLGDYINGKWEVSNRLDGNFERQSPADLQDVVLRVDYAYDNIAKATESANRAFLNWASRSQDERKSYLWRLKELYLSYKDALAEIISRETGKPIWESQIEVHAMISKIDITIDHSMRHITETKIENALPGIDGFIRYKPRGVMAVIGPFNFPGHLPNGHFIPALLTGNTIVFKPSELTPATGQFLAELFQKAQFPPGVFNLVQGDGEVGRRLVGESLIDGILFTGSYDVGLKIKQETLTHYWKILALEMGGKNVSVIWKDADLEKAIYDSIQGAYLSAGQRCSCTSRIVLHKQIADSFIDRFYKIAKNLKIGHWNENPFMGPLISKSAVDKYIRFQEIAKRENAENKMRGKVLELEHKGYYVTPSIHIISKFDSKSVYQTSEIFGPNVAFFTVEDFEAALEINNSSGYGLVMSLFTKDRSLYEQTILKAKVGLINWNRTTNGASSKLPFGGLGKSGNDRPSGDFAINYCTVPFSCLEDFSALDKNQLPPCLKYIDYNNTNSDNSDNSGNSNNNNSGDNNSSGSSSNKSKI